MTEQTISFRVSALSQAMRLRLLVRRYLYANAGTVISLNPRAAEFEYTRRNGQKFYVHIMEEEPEE